MGRNSSIPKIPAHLLERLHGDERAIAEAFAEGQTYLEIGERFGKSVSGVQHMLLQAVARVAIDLFAEASDAAQKS